MSPRQDLLVAEEKKGDQRDLKLEEFRDLARRQRETRIFWDELVKTAHEYCVVNIRVSLADQRGEPVDARLKTVLQERREAFLGAKKVFLAECVRLDLEAPKFEASDICRLAK